MPPNLFTIAADRPFLATLARALVDRTGDDRLALTRITVLLPTRRAVRSLREAFLRLTGEGTDPGAPLLLPRLRAVGDLDDDELTVGVAEGGDALAVLPAMPDLRRRLLLSQLILKWSGRAGGETLLPGQAAALAGALARLLDAAATDGADFARLRDLAPAELAEHWQSVLKFLDILPQSWPGILAEEGALDPAERRNRLLRRQAQLWRQNPPAHPVIAAGLLGGFPALDELLGCIAWLDQGAVILPGLDRRAGPDEWAEIGQDPSHPQHLLAKLLARLEIAPEDVRDWPPGYRLAPAARAARLRLAAEALRPASTTDHWRALPPPDADALAGLSRYDCASPQDEAITAALLLRRQLETPSATAALVTPDRELARRVAAELTRSGIEIDDSAGLPLNRTPSGAFLRLVLDLADSELAPVPLLAALKHPLAAGGLSREMFRDRARRLEEKIRGPRPAPGFDGLQEALGTEAELQRFVDRLRRCLGDLPELLAKKNATVAELATSHIAAAERLAATDEEDGPARLWRQAAGEAAALFCHELIGAARDFPPLAGRDYPALFEALAAGAVVRPAFGRHPRLAIWGLVEARLQQADLLVLGGLNEGTWPGPAAFDPWMSRQMREEFGIALPERAIGIAAHDFAQALGAPQVALTRAARREGVPTVPSRWLLRMDAVLRAAGLENELGPEAEIAGAALARNLPGPYSPRQPARPCPPLAARPRQLSVTQVEMWRRDPYAIYARHILRLRRLHELDADPSRADLGNAVHDALANFVGRHPNGLPADAERELFEIAESSFADWLSRPSVWAFWWPRFERVARWFLAEEAARRGDIVLSVSEQKGSLAVAAPAGPFTVTAVADRIDRLIDGGLAIIDYKTGQLPQKREIDNSLALQLPLEGAIARDGGFPSIAGDPRALEYWRLSGGEPPGQRKAIDDGDPAALIDRTLAEVKALVARFDNPSEPYLVVPVMQWRPRYSDYEHLERLGALREDEIEAAGGEP